MTGERQHRTSDDRTANECGSGYDHYNPVTVYAANTLGVIILGLLALILLIALLRVQAQSEEA